MSWIDDMLREIDSAPDPEASGVQELRRLLLSARDARERGDVARVRGLQSQIRAFIGAAGQHTKAGGETDIDTGNIMEELHRRWIERYAESATFEVFVAAASSANDLEVADLLERLAQSRERKTWLDRTRP